MLAGPEIISDSHRDADRYHSLLLALRRATREINEIGEDQATDLADILSRLLPDVARSLNAAQAFAAVVQDNGHRWLEVLVAHPQQELCGQHLAWSTLFQRLTQDNNPKIIDPLGETGPLIPELEIFGATSAILVNMESIDQTYVVGVCNKVDPNLGPFLAADGKVLDYIVDLVAAGIRVGEQRRQELASIQSTLTALSAELDLDVLLPRIVQEAATVFNAPATSLMLLDDAGETFQIKAKWGLSNEYALGQSISRGDVENRVGSETLQPLLIPDLQQNPFGNVDLIKQEHLRTALAAPLLVRNRLTGILNIYSKDSIRRFTTHEQDLARVFATQAAIAVQNAELFSGAQSRARQLQNVLAGGKNITTLRPIRDVLQAITDGLEANFGYDAVTLFPYQADTETFAAPVISGYLYYPEIVLRKATGDALVENRLTGPKRHFSAHSKKDELLAGAFIERESIQASGYVRLYFGNEIVGILFVNYRTPHVFSADEQQAVQLFADQAAIAIRNAEQYERLRKKERQLWALHQSGAVIAQAGVEVEAVLQTILEQAVTVTGAHFGTIQRLKNDALEFVAAWPEDRTKWLKQKFGNLPLDGPGITVRAVMLNDAQLVPDVRKDPEFINATDETGSELAVVLRQGGQSGGQPIGILNVEHREVGKLNMEDRSLLIQLANLAAITLQNAERAEQLSRTNAVALMGAWGADIAHTVNREVAAIRLALFELEQRQDLPEVVQERLQEIETYVAQLAMPELPEQFPEFGEKLEVRHAPNLDNVIRSEVNKLQERQPAMEFRLDTNCPNVEIAMHEQWLRRILRHFIQNSVNAALETGESVTITVQTAMQPPEQEEQEAMAAVSVEDNGKGVRPEIESLLFHRPIAHTGTRATERHGRGLLLVRYVIELHGGRVQLDWSKPDEGARFTFSIPLA